MKPYSVTIGDVFHMLKVVERLPSRGGIIYYKCLCMCGKYTEVKTGNLRSGNVRSCGCFKGGPGIRKPTSGKWKHGDAHTHFYSKWEYMRGRVGTEGYEHVTVCARWDEYLNFKADMYDAYLEHVKEYGERNTTLDRLDNNVGYEPTNCRWATYSQQNSNRRPYTWSRKEKWHSAMREWEPGA